MDEKLGQLRKFHGIHVLLLVIIFYLYYYLGWGFVKVGDQMEFFFIFYFYKEVICFVVKYMQNISAC